MVISLQEWRDKRNAPLSKRDWQVVELAQADGPRSLNPDGILASLTRGLLGAAVADRLADSKLEALRRFSVRAWFWDVIRTKDLRAFFDAGYTRFNVLEILSHIGMSRGFTPSVADEPVRVASNHRCAHCRCG